MMEAMKAEDLEPIVIEDLVRFGEDRGYERGVREGAASAIARAILDILAQRGSVLDDERRCRLDAEKDPGRLREWLLALVAGRPVDF